MNGMWASLSPCCKHLPTTIWHFINPSPSLHPTQPFIPASPLSPPQNEATRLMPPLRATARLLQMSRAISLTRRDGAANQRKQDICNRSAGSDRKKKKKAGWQVKMCEWWWERGWEDENCRMKERKMCLLCISLRCDMCAQCTVTVDPPTHSSQTLDCLSCYFG